jgi:hypothetical protein
MAHEHAHELRFSPSRAFVSSVVRRWRENFRLATMVPSLPPGVTASSSVKSRNRSYEKALALTQQEPEPQFLQERIRQLK